jgi:hypothetical protein
MPSSKPRCPKCFKTMKLVETAVYLAGKELTDDQITLIKEAGCAERDCEKIEVINWHECTPCKRRVGRQSWL